MCHGARTNVNFQIHVLSWEYSYKRRSSMITILDMGRNKKTILGDLQDQLHWYFLDGPANVEMVLPN